MISRKEARARNLLRYFIGEPCRHGHVAERYTLNGRCVTCNKLDERRIKRKVFFSD